MALQGLNRSACRISARINLTKWRTKWCIDFRFSSNIRLNWYKYEIKDSFSLEISSRRRFYGRLPLRPPCHKTFNYKRALLSWQIHKDFTSQQNCFPGHIGQTLGPPICHCTIFWGVDANLSKTGRVKCIIMKVDALTGALVPYLICTSRADANIDIHFEASLYH